MQSTAQSGKELILSRELRAVIEIFDADNELRRKALPHVHIGREEINWNAILDNDFGGGHSAAILWARSLWADEVQKGDPFERAFAMNNVLKKAVLKALAIRWSIE